MRLPDIAGALRAGIWLAARPTALTWLPAKSARREFGACDFARWQKTRDPRRLQRTLFASLRDYRTSAGDALRQWRHCGRHRPRLPVRALADATAPWRRGLSADGAGAIHSLARGNRTRSRRGHHVPP